MTFLLSYRFMAAVVTTAGALCATAGIADTDAAKRAEVGSVVSGRVDFARDIQPIFTARCVACHGVDRPLGGLRLHRREDALAGGDGGAAIVPHGDSILG
jgi:mono/diheme cytochrome c family protein